MSIVTLCFVCMGSILSHLDRTQIAHSFKDSQSVNSLAFHIHLYETRVTVVQRGCRRKTTTCLGETKGGNGDADTVRHTSRGEYLLRKYRQAKGIYLPRLNEDDERTYDCKPTTSIPETDSIDISGATNVHDKGSEESPMEASELHEMKEPSNPAIASNRRTLSPGKIFSMSSWRVKLVS